MERSAGFRDREEMKKKSPPALASWILFRLLDEEIRYSAMGDFEEIFTLKAEQKGRIPALIYYWIQIIIILPSFIKTQIDWSIEMIKNYLKVTARILRNQRSFSLINIMGLGIGMACCLLILLYVQDELSYDRYHEKAERIYRFINYSQMGDMNFEVAGAAAPAAQVFKDELPEVEDAVRFRIWDQVKLTYGTASYREDKISFCDPSLFNVFTFPLIEGNPETALSLPNTIIISEKAAWKIFGEANAVGQVLGLGEFADLKITGVFKDIPGNSHFHFDFIVSMSSLDESRNPTWMRPNFQTYVLLHKGADVPEVESKLRVLIKSKLAPEIKASTGKSIDELYAQRGIKEMSYLQPLTAIHLHSGSLRGFEPNGDIKYVYILSSIALFILIIACVNFMNLSTARSSGRAKEVGLRKVMGSYRIDLVKQFLSESTILSFISLTVGIIIVLAVLPAFNQLSGKNLAGKDLGSGIMLGAFAGIALLTGLLAGFYPAFVISAFRPVTVLRGRFKTSLKMGPFRRGLVIFQFIASIVLIISTLVIFSQLRFIQNKKIGFNKEQVLVVNNTFALKNQIHAFKNEMLKNPNISEATVSSYLPVPSSRLFESVKAGEDTSDKPAPPMAVFPVDHDYIDTLEMTIIEGRNFAREYQTDSDAVVINRAAVKHFGWDNPLERTLKFNKKTFKVIGVVEDYHFESLRNQIKPVVLYLGDSTGRISFRIKTENIAGTIEALKRKWKEFLPHEQFDYAFFDDKFFSLYQAELMMGKVFGVFSGLAIFVASLGMFGLAAFTAEKKSKEIGIRKVLGATVPQILNMLTREFMILVGISNLIAWPIGYYLMSRWLQGFAYRVSFGLGIFILSGFITVLFSVLAISIQALKAATSDPVKALRYE
jgi:putative ABC transport system permease protein